ncbi:MAG: pyridoxamine 5'-phosphate oxidase family protein [Oscillibacter sp.]|nr:pyridoxamine 5'-phosphate oxidase family protein [Oscillibacter sp.]
MFREMVRKNQQLPREECIEILRQETRGVLSVVGDGGYPYGAPMNHWYNEADGAVYFHCGNIGHRLDALRENDKASFCVCGKPWKDEADDWSWWVKSVIVFGRVEILDDLDTIIDITTKLSYQFTQDADYIRKEIEGHAHRTLLLRLTPEHISGKRVHEA